jgi:ABC-type nitrate/sulfonate/bicarbonate transport system substrate-binding protein
MLKTLITVLIVVAFLLNGIIGCSREQSAPKHEKITIAVSPWPASTPLYIAHEKGYFRDEGLDATLHSYTSGHLGLDAMLSGKADIATAGDTPIARAAIDSKPVAVVATVSEITSAILIIARKDRGISAPDDLRGKKIGLALGSAAEFFLHVYLTTSYINPKEVRIVNIAADKIVDALLNGEVDAVSTWSPFTIVLREKLGSNALILHDPNIYTMTWNIAATQDFVKTNPERIKRFLRAVIRANSFINEHPDEARTISAKHIGTDSPLFEKEWKAYNFTAVLDQSLILNLEDQARWMIKREAGSARRPSNFMDFIYTDGLNAVQPEAVTIAGR